MKHSGHNEFEVRLGRLRAPSGHVRVRGFFRQVGRAGRKLGGTKRHYRTLRRNFAQQSYFMRRVLVKSHIQRLAGSGAKVQALHLKYIERDSAAKDGERGRLFNKNSMDTDRDAFMERSQDDRHQFRIIISPEDAGQLSDLTSYTRDLVRDMEKDLGTSLDWVAANHYDTAQPHIHLVIRGKREDGTDLVIPRKYMAHGMRQRAQELTELELGPVSELEGRVRMARMAGQERLTQIDRGLLARADEAGRLNISGPAPPGKIWLRQVEKKRLSVLARMGLAEKHSHGRWTLKPDMDLVLNTMGERGDKLKAIHRAMNENGKPRILDGAAIYDPQAPDSQMVTGRILQTGVADDIQDRAFIVIDRLNGRPLYVDIGKTENLVGLKSGHIISVHPPVIAPRKSDYTIADIAARNGGLYSGAAHSQDDRKARPEFIQSHIRRLEALQRAGYVKRFPDESWRIPNDYLERVHKYGQHMAARRPADISVESEFDLGVLIKADGANWLDRELRDHGLRTGAAGFGQDVEAAKQKRRTVLISRKLMQRGDQTLSQKGYDALVQSDLLAAGAELEQTLGKPYTRAPQSGKMSGLYEQHISRMSGKYAVIERAKDFTLVPWRSVIDRNLGKSITGHVRGPHISWTLGRGRGIS